MYYVPLIKLCLFDGSTNNVITQAIEVPLWISPELVTPSTFYVTLLNSSCSMELCHNQTLTTIHDNFNSDTTENTTPTSAPKINISLVDVATYSKVCDPPGTQEFCLYLISNGISAYTSSTSDSPLVDMSNVLEEYHDFMDVFNKAKANTLAQHRPYNLKINLKGDSVPLFGQIYSMSQAELQTLQEFLDDHITAGFIRPSQSPHGAPDLFVKKKDGSLHLCVNFHRLNKITKKDHYPLPLITDLLDTPGKAWIYTKINFQHAYYLVCICGQRWMGNCIPNPLWGVLLDLIPSGTPPGS